MRVIIIGAVACGTKVACRLKRLRPDAKIILIDKDEYISYSGCGIPYYLKGDIFYIDELRKTPYKILRDEKFFQEIKGIVTLTKTLVEEIDREKKLIKVKYLDTGKTENLSYDKLVIATGSIPNLPHIPGIDLEGVFTLSNLHDALKIRELLDAQKIKNPLIIGAGLIGLEVCEALVESWELPVTILEYFPQVLPNLIDPFMSRIVENYLRKKGVNLVLNAKIKEIIGKNGKVIGVRTEDNFYQADFILLATGVKPNTELAKKAGLLVSPFTKGIVVNERLQTSDPDIYAGGDCIEIKHLITGKKVVMPMGSLANKQGRIIATNIAGEYAVFKGTTGSFILKCFDMAIGGCGIPLKTALCEGFNEATYTINIQHERTHFFSIGPSYYALIFDRKTAKVLGFQAIGPFTDGTLARIHAISSILPYSPTVEDLASLELPYSPPFNTPLDPIHNSAYIAENIIHKRFKPMSWEEILKRLKEKDENMLIVDVRTEEEQKDIKDIYSNWIKIPYEVAREKIKELPKDKELVMVCSLGPRSYEVARWLQAEGFQNVYVALGGLALPRSWGEEF